MTRPSITDDTPQVQRPRVPRAGGTNGKSRGPAKPKADESRPITPMSLVHALRRRWIPALAVAIPAAILTGIALFEMIGAPYESYAVCKVDQFDPVIINASNVRGSNFLNYRDSQIAYIRSKIVVEAALRKPEVAQTETIKSLQHPVEFLMKKLKVDATESDEMITISLAGDRPRELATIVNAIKDSYMNEVVFAERNEKSSRLTQLGDLLDERKELLSQRQKAIDELARGLGTVDENLANMSIQRTERNLGGLEQDLRKVKSSLLDEEKRRASRMAVGLPPDPIIAPTDLGLGAGQPGQNSSALSAMGEIRRLEGLISRYEDAAAPGRVDPRVAKYKQKIKSLQAKVGSGSKIPGVQMSRYEYLKDQEKYLESSIADAEKLLTENSRKAVQLGREKKKIKSLDDEQERLQKEVNTLRVEILAPTRVNVVHDATAPTVRNTKTRNRLAVIGAVGMFAMVIAAFTLWEWMAQRIASPNELSAEANLRLLGSLPAPERPGMLGKIGFGEPNLSEWNRVLVESVDVVRTYLLRHLGTDGSKAIVIASPSANEGKTTLSTQLGSSIARSGRRVCVVDCDFRRPSAHLVFQTEPGMGISELLRGEADIDTITRETSIPGLCFISAGTVDDESLRVLSMDGGETLLAKLKQHFDYVILDTSPILFVAEPSMIAQHSDAVVLAVRRDYSRMGFVNQACDTLRNLDAPLVGAVMVGAESSIHRQTYGYQQDIRFADPQTKKVKQIAAGV
ncbi:MAG: polysaccharide biosynthesis tyrosine autokinase [Planctomycetaceae bacterium]